MAETPKPSLASAGGQSGEVGWVGLGLSGRETGDVGMVYPNRESQNCSTWNNFGSLRLSSGCAGHCAGGHNCSTWNN
jgi:hypothetical protein